VLMLIARAIVAGFTPAGPRLETVADLVSLPALLPEALQAYRGQAGAAVLAASHPPRKLSPPHVPRQG